MKILRTPDERFTNLPGYPFKPHYVEISDGDGTPLRIHYADEGPKKANPVLLMHGEPTWSYLYRKMIPIIASAGNRVIAPDLIGFGRSDKPAHRNDYTYKRHVDWMNSFLQKTGLSNITLVCQDWGGLIGLRLVTANPDLFSGVVAANTGLPTGDHQIPDAFLAWRKYSQDVPVFDVGLLIKSVVKCPFTDGEAAAYDAPFPDESFKECARIFPSLVPITPDDPESEANRKAWEVLTRFKKPFLTAFSDNDPITRGGDMVFQGLVPGAKGQPHTTIKGGGHFLQEDCAEEFANVVVGFIDRL